MKARGPAHEGAGERRPFADRGPREDNFGNRAPREGSERPRRDLGDRQPRIEGGFGEFQRRDFMERTGLDRKPRCSGFGDRKPRPAGFADGKPRTEGGFGGDRRPFGDRPRRDESEEGESA